MKKFELFSFDTLVIILFSMLIGLIIGLHTPQKVYIEICTFFHNVYVKLHPDSQKDSKTIIMENATKNIPDYQGMSIFDEPAKKDNDFIIFIKKVFHPQKKNESSNINLIFN